MLAEKLDCLPVVKDGELIGIVSCPDMLRVLASLLNEEQRARLSRLGQLTIYGQMGNVFRVLAALRFTTKSANKPLSPAIAMFYVFGQQLASFDLKELKHAPAQYCRRPDYRRNWPLSGESLHPHGFQH